MPSDWLGAFSLPLPLAGEGGGEGQRPRQSTNSPMLARFNKTEFPHTRPPWTTRSIPTQAASVLPVRSGAPAPKPSACYGIACAIAGSRAASSGANIPSARTLRTSLVLKRGSSSNSMAGNTSILATQPTMLDARRSCLLMDSTSCASLTARRCSRSTMSWRSYFECYLFLREAAGPHPCPLPQAGEGARERCSTSETPRAARAPHPCPLPQAGEGARGRCSTSETPRAARAPHPRPLPQAGEGARGRCSTSETPRAARAPHPSPLPQAGEGASRSAPCILAPSPACGRGRG